MLNERNSLLLVVMLLLAGCTASAPAPSESQTGVTEDGTPEPREFPSPPAELTPETAKQTALNYEAAYVDRRLVNSSVDDFGTFGGASFPEASIVNETDSGYYIDVQMPYYYEQGEMDTDTFTRARYFVSTGTINRINGSNVAVPRLSD